MTRALVALGILALAALVLPSNALALPADGPDDPAPATLPSTPAAPPVAILPIMPDGLSLRPHAGTFTPPHEATVQQHRPAASPDTDTVAVGDDLRDAARVDIPGALDVGVSGGTVSALVEGPATPGHDGGVAARTPTPVIPPPEPDPVILPVPRLDQA